MFLVVGLVEVTMGALVETTIFFPMSQLIAIGAEGSPAVFLGYCLEVSKEG